MNRPNVSIVTVTWNHRNEIDPYLDAIEKTRAESRNTLEVIVVDNASADGSAAYIQTNNPQTVVIASAVNTGFALGTNLGLERATGDFLMLLNPDAMLNAAALDGMVDFLRDHPKAGAVGCALLHEDGHRQVSAYDAMSAWSYFLNQSILYPFFEAARKLLHRAMTPSMKAKECGYLMGACIMVPRKVYEDVGGLEPSYFMYCEDADWGARIHSAGFSTFYLPMLTMVHGGKGSSRRAAEFTFRRLYRSVVHYANRNLAGVPRRRLLTTMAWDMRLRIVVYTLLGIALPSRAKRYAERRKSVKRMIAIARSGNPDLYDDPLPR